jgi:hypothetical protein
MRLVAASSCFISRFIFFIVFPHTCTHVFELPKVMDKNISRMDVFMGQVTLRSMEIMTSKGNELRFNLKQRQGVTKQKAGLDISGHIYLSVVPVARRFGYCSSELFICSLLTISYMLYSILFLPLSRSYFRDSPVWTPPIRLDSACSEYISTMQKSGYTHLMNVDIVHQGPVTIVTLREHNQNRLPAFKIENRTPDMRLRFRQQYSDKDDYPRRTLRPAEYCYYAWDNLNLPRVIELAAVDCNDVESPVVSYKMDGVDSVLTPLNVSSLVTKVTYLNVRMQVQGHVRILVVSAVEADEDASDLSVFASLLLHASIDVSFRGVSVVAIDDTPSELFNLSIEGIRCTSLAGTPNWTASVMHVQVNAMHLFGCLFLCLLYRCILLTELKSIVCSWIT